MSGTGASKVASVDDALYALLFDAAFRERFLAGASDLELSPELSRMLGTIDRGELASVAKKISTNLHYGNSDASHGLQASFPLCLEQLGRAGLEVEAVLREFLCSASYGETVDIRLEGRPGRCVEEAFYVFLKTHPAFAGDEARAVLEFEAHKAVVSIFVHNPEPFFELGVLKTLVAPKGRYAVVELPATFVRAAYPAKKVTATDRGTAHVIFAATARGLLHGPISDPAAAEGLLK